MHARLDDRKHLHQDTNKPVQGMYTAIVTIVTTQNHEKVEIQTVLAGSVVARGECQSNNPSHGWIKISVWHSKTTHRNIVTDRDDIGFKAGNASEDPWRTRNKAPSTSSTALSMIVHNRLNKIIQH